MTDNIGTRPNLPLAGVTVIDLGQIYQGPYATMLMARAGADVVKVEPPGGEPIRARTKVGRHAAIPLAMLNSNKRAVTLNLKAAGGRELLKRMAARAPAGTRSRCHAGFATPRQSSARRGCARGS